MRIGALPPLTLPAVCSAASGRGDISELVPAGFAPPQGGQHASSHAGNPLEGGNPGDRTVKIPCPGMERTALMRALTALLAKAATAMAWLSGKRLGKELQTVASNSIPLDRCADSDGRIAEQSSGSVWAVGPKNVHVRTALIHCHRALTRSAGETSHGLYTYR